MFTAGNPVGSSPIISLRQELVKFPPRRFQTSHNTKCRAHCITTEITTLCDIEKTNNFGQELVKNSWNDPVSIIHNLLLADLDPSTAKLAISFVGPLLSAFGFLFVVRIVMSWYPKLPVDKFPYVVAFAPTEPILVPTRKLIPPLGGVDVTPVVWFGLISFTNEILFGPQGLLVLLSQQVV
ncbi:protein COFACTOR ASSEMBLY OF COMPLEX C SUBUNIT B CCB3, chloroplastic [Impatiens glandulifera]|uniref:protein COFACTOR ASSEMBLY OF COMPLEX C SUBUNIT B CCB3, chloroplastic n=1 Tax=Impatiens glandulifera TaxID=253017 RepID=UPI001FB13F61|nr:protein COFACTOR ASSEMBLY OF COMPLEX C SUBUNIT B CCB3, chloroplastic [Impatiens glandulifera]